MKKLFALLLVLALMVSVAACSSQELTMQQLIEANQTEALLESHDSICAHTTIADKLYSAYYVTDTYSYENHETWSMYVTDDAGYGYQNGMYTGVVCLTRDGLVDFADYRAGKYADVVISQESLQEKIQSVDKTENQITVTTSMKERTLEKIVGEKSLHSMETTYIMDPETYGIMTINGILTLDDSSTIDVLMECSYNEEMPEDIRKFMEYENQTENLRTITLVFHVGTATEKAETVEVPKGLPLWLVLPEDVTESFSVYADAACTVPHESNGDYTSDATVYIK